MSTERERLKARARMLYQGGKGGSLAQVAAEVGIPLATVKRWCRDGGWHEPAPVFDPLALVLPEPRAVDLVGQTIESIKGAIADPRTRVQDRIAALEFLEARERARGGDGSIDLRGACDQDLADLEILLRRCTGGPEPATRSPEVEAMIERSWENKPGSIGWLKSRVATLEAEVSRLTVLASAPDAIATELRAAEGRHAAEVARLTQERDDAQTAEKEARKAALVLASRA